MVSDYLTKTERLAAIRFGALDHAGYMDACDAMSGSMAKSAQNEMVPSMMEAVKDGTVLVALMSGIPIGVAAHHIGRRMAGRRMKEEELKEKIRLYRNASDELAEGLS